MKKIIPDNRIGSAVWSTRQFKGLQEGKTRLVIAGLSISCLGQPLKWNHWPGFALIAVAAWLMFLD